MGECFVKKRYITSLVAGGLMAALLPGAAMAQTEAEGTVTFGDNVTCEYGQGSAAALPACEASEDGTIMTLTFLNPQIRTGPFDGISVLDGVLVGNFAEATFEVSGSVFFAGEVEGCGEGTVLFDYAGSGIQDETGALIWETNLLTSAPGGTLPVTATIDELGTNEAVPNGDGSSTLISTVTYSCDAAA
jgi:hypothetical protein